MLSGAFPLSLCIFLLLRIPSVQPFDAPPRWGQAVALLNNSLFVHGGKTDQFNSYSYTSAPNTNDLLYLPLTSSFSTASPPWTLVSNSTNSSSLQGPSLAWHTLSPCTLSNVLLFGGDPDPNSPTVEVSAADSAEILNVASPLHPVWSLEPASWAGEPVRRMRHSTATTSSSQVFIIGGEKADGSGNAFADHYVFNPTIPSFTLLPPNGPPDIYGHASIILSDGRLLVFGGYSPSQETLLPFSTIWVFNTSSQSTLAWTAIQTSTSLLPSPRMAFAAVSLDNGGILIHGGSDAYLQTNFADGWILDTSQSIMSWTQVEGLSQLGALRDHFAVRQGDLVLFGFGYGDDGPAPPSLQIYNSSSQSYVSLFEPLPPTPTTPTSSQTGKSTTSPTSRRPSSTSSSTTTADPNNPNLNPSSGADRNSSSRTKTVVVSATLGSVAFIVILLGTAYYLRRRQHGRGDRRFMALGGDDRGEGADSPHFDSQIPAVNTRGELSGATHGGNRGLLSSLGLSGAIGIATGMKNTGHTHQRRDMLADEDTRSFGEWYASRGRDATGGSSWSLRSILGGGTRLLSREPSTASRGTTTGSRHTPRKEQSEFADGASFLRDEDTGFMGVSTVARPNGRRQMSHASSKSGLSYRDPFSDPVQEERRQRSDPNNSLLEEEEIYDPLRISVRHVTALPSLMTTVPLSRGGHALSPLSEHTSTIPESTVASSHGHSSETVITPLGRSSSLGTSRSSLPPSSTIMGTIHNGMRRTDSWWTRFARTTLLDRRSSKGASGTSLTNGRFEIRDPKPPPRLDAIAENIHSISRADKSSEKSHELVPSQQQQQQQQDPILGRISSIAYGMGYGRKSVSSLLTVDSEAIERMAGTMDVFQRIKTSSSSHRTTGSIGSIGWMSVDTRRSSDVENDSFTTAIGTTSQTGHAEDLMTFSSPVEMLPLHSSGILDSPPRLSSPPLLSRASQPQIVSTPSSPRDGSIRPIGSLPNFNLISPTSPSVADRIKAFERRASQEQTSAPSATNTKHREERTKKRITVDYGLIPRANLFVANPDSHRLSTSGDS